MHGFMHEIMKIKSKGRAKKSYQLEERDSLQKNPEENDKKLE